MDAKFIPSSESLKETDFRKPQLDKSNKKHVLLFLSTLAMLVVVFIPWFCIGIEIEDIGSFKLRSFGFDSWCGIVGGVLALVSIAGVIYKHYALTMWSSLAAVVISLFAFNIYPDSRVNIDLDNKVERVLKGKVKEYENRYEYDRYDRYERHDRYADKSEVMAAKAILTITDLPTIKIPGQLVEYAALAIECIDQDAVYELIEKNADKDMAEDIDFINHRLGNILFMVFAVLGTVLAYIMIARPKKETVTE
jgi:phosphotransferase system  glucose/maltose/N-acetylglucosamine-specific IIC component